MKVMKDGLRYGVARRATFDDGSTCEEMFPFDGLVRWTISPDHGGYWQAHEWADARRAAALSRPGAVDAGVHGARLGPDGDHETPDYMVKPEGYGPLPPGAKMEWCSAVDLYMAGMGGLGRTPYLAALSAWECHDAQAEASR